MGRGDLTNAEWVRLEAHLPAAGLRGGRWCDNYYNYHRPHGALGGQTPYERLKQKTEAPV